MLSTNENFSCYIKSTNNLTITTVLDIIQAQKCVLAKDVTGGRVYYNQRDELSISNPIMY